MFSFPLFPLHFTGGVHTDTSTQNSGVFKRRLPYPFISALTLCSDIDGTDTLKEFLTIQEFLNTKNDTPMGIGVGLEIGNSFYPIHPDGKFALISHNPSDQEVILDLIKLGYIDFIHSFNTAKDRAEIQQIMDILRANECTFDVWVNHSNVPNNLGPGESCMGDDNGSKHYHTDFSIKELGYRFIWTDAVTSIVGQGRPLRLSSFFASLDKRHFLPSLHNNVFKEICKYLLSPFKRKYNNRRTNDLIYPYRLNDGQHVFDFARCDVFYDGIGPGASADGLAHVLREDIFKSLNHSQGYMIVYTHLGKNSGYPYLTEESQKALRLLEKEHKEGNIFVTTTAKMLTYYANNKYLQWRVDMDGNIKNICIENISDPARGTFVPIIDDLRGMTFYTDDPENTNIIIDGARISEMARNDRDFTGRSSVMIPIKWLPPLDSQMKEYKKKGYF